jgi:hypothetical protein
MATTTTNFGWDIPQSTDLVKDGATAIAALGQDIDTALVDLKGGTSGQVLAKASNTDLDFSWVAQDDSNAIQNAIVDAKGDLIAATADNTPARLAVGSNGQVLTVDSTTATGLKWETSTASKVIAVSNSQTGTVATGTTTIPQDNTIPQNTEGDQYMTLSYTPTSASSKLQIDVVAFGSSSANCSMVMALFQDSVANALAATTQYNVGGPTNNYAQTLKHTMTAGTTSAILFKVRIGLDNAGTFTFNGRGGNQLFGGVGASSITVTEYTP